MQITLAQQIEGSINFKLSFKTSDSLEEVRPVIFSLGTKHLILEYTWPLYRSICVCVYDRCVIMNASVVMDVVNDWYV